MLYDTLNLKTGKTGHLVFDEFIEPSTQELQTAFAFFKAQNVKDLILDLRYNSGGIWMLQPIWQAILQEQQNFRLLL